MRRRASWRLATAFSLVVVAGLVAVPDTALAAPAIRLSAPAKLRVADVPGSVDYLTRKYGISVDEAMRRLELQRTSGALHTVLARDHADTYAGSWIDQENGGVLVIASTAAEALVPALSAVPDRNHVRVVAARHSLKELKAKAADVGARLGLTPEQAPVINEQKNRVELHNQAAAAVRGSAGRLATAGDLDVTVIDPPTITPQRGPCEIQACFPPMRGGLRLDLYDVNYNKLKGDFCTSGFNVKGSNGWKYTLTAGHCLIGESYYTKHTDVFVGRREPLTRNSEYPADGALMPFVTRGFTEYVKVWAIWPYNTVIHYSTKAFPIFGMWAYDDVRVGWVVCSTGARSDNTRCGDITKKDGGFQSNICTQSGDSGSPLYSEVDNKAYGILHGSSGLGCWTGKTSYWSSLTNIFNMAKKSGLTFELVTDPDP
ncbi:S1 family peptidase [Nonomuraea sp. NPDC049750]|uniref:S1 family peptidase n=1 Tax=Nonomuraea sp. NPDC049750 TaxID=3154738 RepID=UPI0033E75FC3